MRETWCCCSQGAFHLLSGHHVWFFVMSSPPNSQASRWLWRWFVQALQCIGGSNLLKNPQTNCLPIGVKGQKKHETIICEGPQNQGSQLNTVYSTGCRKICLWGACRLCLPGSNIIYKDFKTLSSRSCFLSCDLVKIPYFEIQETTLRNTLNLILKMFFFFYSKSDILPMR